MYYMKPNIRQATKNLLLRLFSNADLYPTRLTDIKEVHSLLASLHPLELDQPLIRFGPRGDGGYLIPDDLDGISACYSPGVNRICGFEIDCALRGMKVFLADASVEKPAEQNKLFHFTKKNIGVTSGNDSMTLDDWIQNSSEDTESDLMLQMDIEGCEYEVILSTPTEQIKRFRIIVVEFHWLEQLWNRPFFSLANRAFEKLLETHICVHIHPNNACGYIESNGIKLPVTMEFTFASKARFSPCGYQQTFPHPLDFDNVPNESLPLPDCWYRMI